MIQGMLEDADLTKDERACVGVLKHLGRVSGSGNSIRADLLAQLALGRGPIGSSFSNWRRLQFEQIRVVGRLDLADSDNQAALLFADCVFESDIDFSRSSLVDLRFQDCDIWGELLGQSATLRHNLLLNRVTVRGALNITLARIGGTLLLAYASLTASDDFCFQFDGGAVDGPVTMRSLRLASGFSARGTRFRTQVVLDNLQFGGNPAGAVLQLDKSTLDSELQVARVRGLRRFSLLAATSGSDVVLVEVGGWGRRSSLRVDRSTIRGGLIVDRCVLLDGMSLTGCELGLLRVEGSTLWATGAKVAEGKMSLSADEGPDSYAVAADGIVVRGDVGLGPDTHCLGEVRLIGGAIGGQLRVLGGRAPMRLLLNAEDSDIKSGLFVDEIAPVSHLHLMSGRFGSIIVNSDYFPKMALLGASYGRINDIEGRVLTGARGAQLLAMDPGPLSIAPYRFMANWMREQGDDEGAQLVSIAGERRVRAAPRPSARGVLYWAWEKTVGFGYAPLRALPILAAVLTIGTAVFALAYGGTPSFGADVWFSQDGQLALFNPFIAALGALVPGGFAWNTWIPIHPIAQITTVVLSLVGWALITAVVAGIANRIRRR